MGCILISCANSQRRSTLRVELEREGHLVGELSTSGAAPQESATGYYDLLIIDSCIGGSDVYALCRSVRRVSELGIIVLFEEPAGEQSRIDALNAGADDYISGAFVLPELHARIRAILRRVRNRDDVPEHLMLKDRAIDFRSHKIQGPGEQVTHLTPKEFQVLKYLITRADKPVNHRELAQTVWQRDGSGDLEYVRIVIGQLRRKIEPDYNSPQYILTERSIGYRFTVSAGRTDNQAMAQ